MAKIFEMSPHLADLIAAGEVVERPGSVVKELVENSIDAGATYVTVEIRNGGMSMIRVTDNGCGIAREDVTTAFLRHATSKLRNERDLEAIGTLGFRGEALAAIASVSHIELITKERDAHEGTSLVMEAGEIITLESAGCPDGTTMIVRDLFFNTPARLKYMKNDKAEGTNVSAVVTRLALSHPEVSVRYIKDGKEECHTPGDGRIDSCVYSTLGREFAKSLIKAESGEDNIKVTGFVSSPAGCRGNRSWQFFFLNGRYIRSKLLQAALEQAYKNSLFTGRFPVCVLNISVNPGAVDVNVHPTKLEVRFSDEKKVFDAVYWAVRGALEKEDRSAEIEISPGTASKVISPAAVREEKTELPSDKGRHSAKSASGFVSASPKAGKDFYKTLSADQFKGKYSSSGGFKTAVPALGRENHGAEVKDSFRAHYQTQIDMPETKNRMETKWEPDAPVAEEKKERPWRYVGEALDTYLIVEKGSNVYFIDKHAAHERILFDKLKEKETNYAGQVLIAPIVCNTGADSAEIIIENAELLAEFGFDVSLFGEGSILLRQVPADTDIDEPTAFMEEIAEKLGRGGRQSLDEMRDEVMHSVACKAAIKAGTRSEPETVYGLIDKVMAGEVRYCPHGRPVMMELSKTALDKNFKRT